MTRLAFMMDLEKNIFIDFLNRLIKAQLVGYVIQDQTFNWDRQNDNAGCLKRLDRFSFALFYVSLEIGS